MSKYRATNVVPDITGEYLICLDAWHKDFTYNGPGGVLDSEWRTDPITGNVFMKSYTYTNGNLTHETGWSKQ